ncbi:MAG: H(+)/Cl(-) exchange transporter ClcA [Myxococcota bacterium]
MKLPFPIAEATSAITTGAAQSTRLASRVLEAQRKGAPLLLTATVVGALTGTLASLFHKVLDWAEAFRNTLWRSDDPVVIWGIIPVAIALCLLISVGLVRRWAPEAGGSGVQVVEGLLDGALPMRWARVIPIKFIGGCLSLGSGLLMGREGPSIQIGAAIGQGCVRMLRLPKTLMHGLVASGAAAGLTAAFNAPFAGILFMIEEMRPQFHYNVLSVQAVVLACAVSDVVTRLLTGDVNEIAMPILAMPERGTLWLFVVFGVLFGFLGFVFERVLLRGVDWFRSLRTWPFIAAVAVVGLSIGWLGGADIRFVGGGEDVLEGFLTVRTPMKVLALVFAVRFMATVASYSTGAPGGLFAPMLAIGTIAGVAYGQVVHDLGIGGSLVPAHFAVAGMGAFFAAVVRAPLTGIILTAEMTGNFTQILPLMLTCMAATITAHGLGTRPIYTALLERALARAGKPQDEAREREAT